MLQLRARRHVIAVVATATLLFGSCSSGDEAPEPRATTATTATLASTTTTRAATTTSKATTTTSSSTTAAPPEVVLDLAQDPLVLFGAIPPMPPGANLPLPQGSADYFDLFSPGADWELAASRVDVFKLHAWQVRHFLSIDQLLQIVRWLEANGIPLMFETEPLQPPDPEECDHTESADRCSHER